MVYKFNFIVFLFCLSCNPKQAINQEYEFWISEWEMAENVMNGKYDIAANQFDDLLKSGHELNKKIFVFGLEAKLRLNKLSEVKELLSDKPIDYWNLFCEKAITQDLELCTSLPLEKVTNVDLRMMILTMYFIDQYIRGNSMNSMIAKYQLDTVQICQSVLSDPDNENTEALREIILNFGFPTKSMVGTEAMNGIFYIIQHSRDSAFQEEMLPYIKISVENKELDPDVYAYLLDRVNIRKEKKQLFGTQIKSVDFDKGELLFFPIKDSLNIDKRRMQYGMEPFEIYKKLILNSGCNVRKGKN